MKKIFKYFSSVMLLTLILSGCSFIKKDQVDPDYGTGLTQAELFSFLNKEIGYKEDKNDNYVYFSFYLDHQVVYSFSNESTVYSGDVIEFKYKGKNHFEVSCQFDPQDNQNFVSFVKTFDILFDEQNPEKIEITFDGNTRQMIIDKGLDSGTLLLSLQLYKNYFIDFTDVSLYVGFYEGDQFSYDNGSEVIAGTVDIVTYLGNDVYDINIKGLNGENQKNYSFLIAYTNAYPEKLLIELPNYGLVEMKADKGYDTVEILSILALNSPFEELNGNNIRIFDAENFHYSKTNINGDYLLDGIITTFDYKGRSKYEMAVTFSSTNDLENEESTYVIEVTFTYNEKEKLLYLKEYDVTRKIEENYIFKTKN
ncbi:MAG: hypothetical protein ACOX1F_04775 [Erysipelotrichaceae bacterium]